MNGTIRIPIDYDRDTKYETVTITPEIQAQILAPAMERIAALEKHQHRYYNCNEGLFTTKPTVDGKNLTPAPVAAVTVPNGTVPRDHTGMPPADKLSLAVKPGISISTDENACSALMLGGARPAPVAADKPAPKGCPHPASYRTLEGSEYCDVCHENLSASQPAGDDAAVEALYDIVDRLCDECGINASEKDRWTVARSIIAAIRRGEAPGITTWEARCAEVNDLRNKAAELERERDNWRKCHDIVEQERAIPCERQIADANAALDLLMIPKTNADGLRFSLQHRIGLLNDDAQREVGDSMRSANYHGEQYARICGERDKALARVAELERERDALKDRLEDPHYR